MAQKKKSKKTKKNSGGFGLFLIKAILLAALVAAVFWGVTKGLDWLEGRGKKTDVTPTVTGAPKTPTGTEPTKDPKNPDGGTKAPTAKPDKTPTESTKTPTPAPTDTPTPTEAPKNLTAAAAVEKLKGLSAAKLKLPADPSKYTYEPDDWTSVIEGKECVCVNVLSADGLRVGVYYVAVDGSKIFREAEDNVFETIAP